MELPSSVVVMIVEAPPAQRRLLRSEDPRPSVLPEHPDGAADGRCVLQVMVTDGFGARRLEFRSGRGLHHVQTVCSACEYYGSNAVWLLCFTFLQALTCCTTLPQPSVAVMA